MGNIEDIVDSEWQPLLDKNKTPVVIREHTFSEGTSFYKKHFTTRVIKLKNGLFYAIVKQSDGTDMLRDGNYPIEEFQKLFNKYHLSNLSAKQRGQVPGFSATFEYKSGKTPGGHDAARIEYTTWHNPAYGDKGLTMLTSLYAMQRVKDGWLDVNLNVPSDKPVGRSMISTISTPDTAKLIFGTDGNLLTTTFDIQNISEQENHPLKDIYLNANRGIGIDTLKTAEALVKGFPSQRPLQMEKLVQYMK